MSQDVLTIALKIQTSLKKRCGHLKSAMFIPHLKIRTSLCQFFLNYSTSILFFIFMNLLSCAFHTVVFIESNTCWKSLENNNVFVMIGFTVQSDHMIFVYIRIYSALVRSRMFSISLLITLLTFARFSWMGEQGDFLCHQL